jgi:alkylation response protein AidB-like acyl-CoA dehydrogenase
VWERLGRFWPALGWASVQTHVAIAAIGSSGRRELCTPLIEELHRGDAAVAVVDTSAPHVDLSVVDDMLSGSVARVDVAHATPHLLVLDGTRSFLVLRDEISTIPQRCTGLHGAMTRALTIESLPTVPLPAASERLRATLCRGAAAVAAGIAGAAADTAAAYVAQRRQFGAPLMNLPTVRASVDDQLARVRLGLAALWGAAEEAVVLTDALRAITSDAVDITAAALQLHGGYGYLKEYPSERFLRDAVSLRAATSGFDHALQEAR